MIKLYIGDYQADVDTSVSIIFSLEDLSNPSNITTSRSRTIELKGTKQNNKIFGDYWKLDKYITSHTGNPTAGANYDPSKRVSSEIYENGSLLAKGYVKLDSISRVKQEITYNITFYDQVADFFYNLKYKQDGSTRTLADLRYFIKSDNQLLPEDTEFNFRINKDLVSKCFLNDYSDDNDQLTDFLTFVPSYNGLYEDFDNQSVLINTNGDDVFSKSITQDDVEYSAVNGYLLGKMNNDFTEWETRDLRSYKQRPAIKLSKLIETICRKENSGYDVELDSSFFNKSNPYWYDSFVILPLLGSNNESNDENKVSGTITSNSLTLNKSNSYITTELTNTLSDTSKYPYNANATITLNTSLSANSFSTADRLWISTTGDTLSSICCQLVAYNESDQIVGYSPVYNFTNGRNSVNPEIYSGFQKIVNSSVSVITGNFYRENGKYYFRDDSANDTFDLTLTTTKTSQNLRIILYSQWLTTGNVGDLFTVARVPVNQTVDRYTTSNCSVDISFTGSSVINWYSNITSGSLVTKETLLKNEKSCCDYLLSFTKLFGLYFLYDNQTVKIVPRNKFFTGKVVNLEDEIDYSKDLTITPILFDKKYYRMKLEFPNSTSFAKYKTQYDQVYGQQRVDTGYNFNSETNDLFGNIIYQGCMPVSGTSKWYRNFYRGDKLLPAYLVDGLTVTYYNGEDSADYQPDNKYTNLTEFNRVPGNDIFPKIELCNESNQLQDITSSLVFFNGFKTLMDSKNQSVNYWVTDDLTEMGELNEDNCWLYTKSNKDLSGKEIAFKLSELPQFLPVKLDYNNNVINSFDIGLPKEIYIDCQYTENQTLYHQFWKDLYNDQLNVNTKKINCFVKLDSASQESLRDFYWFDNAYWIINKIDYNPTSHNTTPVEFIKVWDLANYTD